MRRLIALDLDGGQEFVDAMRRAWDDGDAVLPLDRRLPRPQREHLVEALDASVVVDSNGEVARPGAQPIEDGDALVVATSGTTGAPKGVVLTHAAVTASALATSDRLGVTTSDHWLACLPLAHVGGLSVVTRSLVTDTKLTVLPAFDAEAVMAAARDGATLVSLVATALSRIDPRAFRRIVLGGAKPPAIVPLNASVTYGMTETGSGVVYDGRPLDGVEIRIGADDMISLRCPMLLRAYRDGSVPLDRDGWFVTGDLGRFEPDGRLHVDGRQGELIITGGENVWPGPVEDVLRGRPRILDVVVLGEPDAEWGQRVVALVVADPAPTLAQVRDWVKESLPSFCAPRRLVIVEQIPRTALGKPRYEAIRAQLDRTPAPPSIT
jgi:O-succinylbenzoic acid--CoA ligase